MSFCSESSLTDGEGQRAGGVTGQKPSQIFAPQQRSRVLGGPELCRDLRHLLGSQHFSSSGPQHLPCPGVTSCSCHDSPRAGTSVGGWHVPHVPQEGEEATCLHGKVAPGPRMANGLSHYIGPEVLAILCMHRP